MSLVESPRLGSRPGSMLAAWPLVQRRIRRAGGVQLVLAVAGAAYVVAFAGTGLLRAIYPYTIDGVEPGALQEVRRVLAGQPLYVAPELGYVPLIYGPVFFYVAAALGGVAHSALVGMRLTSLLASLGSIGLIGWLVRRETGNWSLALVGGGLLAACSPAVDMSMDVGRMDALSLVLLLGSACAARQIVLDDRAGWRWGITSGALMGLAILTKQTSLVMAAALGLLLLISRPRQVILYVAAAALVIGGGMLLLVLQSGPWPVFYLWQLPRGHELRIEFLPRFWSDLLGHFSLAVVFGPFYLLRRWLLGDHRRLLCYGLLAAGLVGMAWLSDASLGGGRNVELPAYAAFALLFALALSDILRLIPVRAMRTYAIGVAVVQFAILVYNPRLVVPYRSDGWDGDRLQATLAALPGPIFAGSFQGYVTDPSAVAPDLGAVTELTGVFGGGGVPPGTPSWESQFVDALKARRFTYVIINPDIAASVVTDLLGDFGYQDAGPLFPPGDVYWNWRTGWSPKAEVYVRSGA